MNSIINFDLWVATHNQGKWKEFQTLLKDLPLKLNIHSLNELSYYAVPEETGATLLDNSRIKARSLHAVKPNAWVLADDTGLEVDGLNGNPGVHSARYAGQNASDAENISKLLQMLKIRSPKNRTARFISCLVLLSPIAEEHVFQGELRGTISLLSKGNYGFGYDSVFVPEGCQKTFAEMDHLEKNAISHRSQAFHKLKEFLKQTSLHE